MLCILEIFTGSIGYSSGAAVHGALNPAHRMGSGQHNGGLSCRIRTVCTDKLRTPVLCKILGSWVLCTEYTACCIVHCLGVRCKEHGRLLHNFTSLLCIYWQAQNYSLTCNECKMVNWFEQPVANANCVPPKILPNNEQFFNANKCEPFVGGYMYHASKLRFFLLPCSGREM